MPSCASASPAAPARLAVPAAARLTDPGGWDAPAPSAGMPRPIGMLLYPAGMPLHPPMRNCAGWLPTRTATAGRRRCLGRGRRRIRAPQASPPRSRSGPRAWPGGMLSPDAGRAGTREPTSSPTACDQAWRWAGSSATSGPAAWRGYFAGRAGALGPVGAAPVIAAFYGFAPPMVGAGAARGLAADQPGSGGTGLTGTAGAVAALRRVLDGAGLASDGAARPRGRGRRAPLFGDGPGRGLRRAGAGAANLALPVPDEPPAGPALAGRHRAARAPRRRPHRGAGRGGPGRARGAGAARRAGHAPGGHAAEPRLDRRGVGRGCRPAGGPRAARRGRPGHAGRPRLPEHAEL